MAKKLAFDKTLFTAIVGLVGFGLVMVYSASAAAAREAGTGFNPFLAKQAVAAGLGLTVMGVAMHVDYQLLRRRAVVYAILLTVLVLLVAVLFSPALNNVRRWFFIGPFSFQPSELAKLAIVPFLALQIERKWDRINHPHFLIPCGVILAVISGLVVLQPDFGTAVLILSVAGTMIFLAGLSWRYIALSSVAVAPVLFFLVKFEPYRFRRFTTFLDPDKEPLGAGFQITQSLIAVGSGGSFGLGLGKSIQKLFFLPHPHSDFVFAIVCEELGLLGAVLLLAGFGVFLWRGARAGLAAPDRFGTFLAWGLTSIVVIQALTHMSVALALLPTTGVPMPFISYGGSSLLTTMAACGVLLNVSQHG